MVEDEETIREGIAAALRREGHVPVPFDDGLLAWQTLEADLPDLAILDIGLPQMDGLELCRRLRARSALLPIVFVTSREEEFDRVLGLEIGADDYLCKPFSMRELMARVKVLLRRAHPPEGDRHVRDEVFHDRRLTMDPIRLAVTWNGAVVSLTVTEFLIVAALARRPGHVKSRKQLLEEGYPHDAYVSERTVDSHIKRLRAKFAEIDPAFEAIDTVHGLGYRYREDSA